MSVGTGLSQGDSFGSGVFKANWILSPRDDMIWLIGSVLAAYAVFAMHSVLGWNMLIVWFVWVMTLDTPHFFATYSRTYFDKVEWQARKPLLIITLGVFLIGPIAIVVAFASMKAGLEFFLWPWLLFKIAVSLWAYWHITRQHYGVMRLYHRKNGETGTFDAKLDSVVLYGCLLVPFVALLARHQHSRERVGLPSIQPFPEMAGLSDMPSFAGQLYWDQWVVVATVFVVAVLVTVFVVRQVSNFLSGKALNLPKFMFFGAVLPLHIYMCYTEHLLTTGLLTFTAVITIYHDIQYLAIVWFYNRNRYGSEKNAERKFGLAAKMTKKLWIWMGIAILFGSVPVWGLGCLLNRIPVCQYGPPLGEATFLGETTWIAFFVVLTAGLQMHHYVLDQFIWKPGSSKQLRKDMKL